MQRDPLKPAPAATSRVRPGTRVVDALGSIVSNYALQRALTAAGVFSAMLFGAWAIDQSAFARILLMMFLAKFLHIANLGATNGFFVSYYNRKEMFEDYSLSAERVYCLSLFAHLLGLIVPLGLLSWLAFPQYLPGMVAFALIIPLYVLEPPFRLRRRFYMSLMPDILLSTSVVVTSLLILFVGSSLALSPTFVFLVALALVAAAYYAFLWLRVAVSRGILREIPRLSPKPYLRCVLLGLPVYLGTTLFMVASGLDRLLLPLHAGEDQQAVYMLSYQLATGAMILLASVNFVNTIDLGEAHSSGTTLAPQVLARRLPRSVGLAIVSLAAISLLGLLLERVFLEGYENLLRVTATLAAGLSVFFVAGAVTPVLAYLRKQTPMTLLMGCAASIILLNNLISIYFGYDIIWLSSVTATILGGYGALAVAYTLWVCASAHRQDELDSKTLRVSDD